MSSEVYIVDDDKLARESLAWLIDTVGLRVKVYESGFSFLDDYRDTMAGCLVLDVRMPALSGMDLHIKLKQLGCRLPIIMMTGHADVAMAVRAMKAGVYDFIEKPYNDSLMLERIQSAIAFDLDTRKKQERELEVKTRLAKLTPRENEVLHYILKSTANKNIAAELLISIKTVELHRSNLMLKMQASSATELVRLALIAGFE
ncbi:MAG: response regulator transcription factor [Thiohalomonadales bacterium]